MIPHDLGSGESASGAFVLFHHETADEAPRKEEDRQYDAADGESRLHDTILKRVLISMRAKKCNLGPSAV